MSYLISKSNIILFFLFFIFLSIFSDEESNIKDFLKGIKTHDDIKANINFKNLISYQQYTSVERLKKFSQTLNLNFEDVVKEIKVVFPNEAVFKSIIEKEKVLDLVNKVDLNKFNLNYEIKRLKEGEILILIDDGNKRLKIPVLLIYENKQFKFDARTFMPLSTIPKFNNLLHIEYGDKCDVLTFGGYHYFNRDIDYTYLIETLDRFKFEEEKEILGLLVYYGSFFSSILKVNGAKLLNKNISLAPKEKKLIAAQLHFSIYNFKDPKIEDIKDAYSIAEEIIKTMTTEEKNLYQIKKNNE